MAYYRKKPVVIEAIQFTEETSNQVAMWIASPHFLERDEAGNKIVRLPTLEGDMIATLGDWIIKGVAGEFYPCKPDIFAKTYELVEGP